MKIGKALKKIRLDLGLSQAKMCEGIIQRPFYALVESGKSGIGAESLIMILIKHEVDIDYFFHLVKDEYATPEARTNQLLQNKMEYAVNSKNINAINFYEKEIGTVATDEILKLRAQVAAAYFSNQLDELNDDLIMKIYKKFDKEEWTNCPSLLRLLANTMPLWEYNHLTILMKHLLHTVQRRKVTSELMMERYIRILENYLVSCYDRKKYKDKKQRVFIEKVLGYLMKNTTSFHFMIYRFHAYYMKALFEDDKITAKNIIKSLEKYGYGKVIVSWPKIEL
ncbi:helix-turn-helix domain-containing protein [Lactobacillus mulieris]|uniref:helix-turn-helix domain-containing protein n=1 Tax=Lactobacillus mulieris TaxID=2508708 RepID=UPI0022CDA111|nr:helix-turn-helix transcriptional regulator [Lactobacillus mulieris]MCZ9648363.1 helix-turn-helix domain-containing protein [Lactobacillus mulieris]